MKTTNKFVGKNIFLLALLAGATGCAANTENFKAAQAFHAEALSQTDVAALAPVHMEQAQKNLNLAEKQSNEARQDHLSYVATKHVEIALADADRKTAEKALVDESKNRTKALLTARTQEADQAHQDASQAQQRSREAEERALTSKSEANEALAMSNSMASNNEQLRKELADLKSRETQRGLEITLAGSYFEIAKSNLKPGAKLKLDSVARAMRENPNQQALVEGHTDNTGSKVSNQDLSQQRADSVTQYLIDQGVEPSHVVARGYGETYPTVSNNTPSGRQQNRRVDIVLLNKNEGQKDLK